MPAYLLIYEAGRIAGAQDNVNTIRYFIIQDSLYSFERSKRHATPYDEVSVRTDSILLINNGPRNFPTDERITYAAQLR